MNEREALREQMYGVNSHLHLLHALEGLDPQLAGTPVAGAPHTIFQVVQHMVYWQDLTLVRLQGGNPPRPRTSALGWQAPATAEDESEWEAAIAGLAEGLRAIEGLLADAAFDLDAVADAQRGTVAREEVLMIQAHNSYHLGQIVLLRRQLGAWPPPKGGDAW